MEMIPKRVLIFLCFGFLVWLFYSSFLVHLKIENTSKNTRRFELKEVDGRLYRFEPATGKLHSLMRGEKGGGWVLFQETDRVVSTPTQVEERKKEEERSKSSFIPD